MSRLSLNPHNPWWLVVATAAMSAAIALQHGTVVGTASAIGQGGSIALFVRAVLSTGLVVVLVHIGVLGAALLMVPPQTRAVVVLRRGSLVQAWWAATWQIVLTCYGVFIPPVVLSSIAQGFGWAASADLTFASWSPIIASVLGWGIVILAETSIIVGLSLSERAPRVLGSTAAAVFLVVMLVSPTMSMWLHTPAYYRLFFLSSDTNPWAVLAVGAAGGGILTTVTAAILLAVDRSRRPGFVDNGLHSRV